MSNLGKQTKIIFFLNSWSSGQQWNEPYIIRLNARKSIYKSVDHSTLNRFNSIEFLSNLNFNFLHNFSQ